MHKGVAVFVEQRSGEIQSVSLELLGKGKELANKLGEKLTAILLGNNIDHLADELIYSGADEVVVVNDPVLDVFVTEPANSFNLASYARPGKFNDMDMLEVGMLKGKVKSAFGKTDPGITRDEEVTHFGMWCIMTSPLMLGCDVRNMDSESLKLVKNPFLVRMNQDPLGLQAYVAAREGEVYMLTKDAFVLRGTSRYVAVCNTSDKEKVFAIKARDLDLAGSIAAFDLVERGDLGEFTDEVTIRLRPHASKFYLFDAERRLDRVVYEAEGAFLAEYDNLGKRSQGSRIVPTWYDVEGASGGMVVANLGGNKDNTLTWNDIYVPKSGEYTLTLRIRTDKDCAFYMTVNDGEKILVQAKGGDNAKFIESLHTVKLNSGSNKIRLFNLTDKLPEIDCLKVEKIN